MNNKTNVCLLVAGAGLLTLDVAKCDFGYPV